jgi:hypothetical protein
MLEQHRLAVHRIGCASDGAASFLDDRLMTEAHADHRHAPLGECDEFETAASVARSARPRRDHDDRAQRLGLRQRCRSGDAASAHMNLVAEAGRGFPPG